MANPVFSGYKYKYADYRTPSGEISDVIVSGDTGLSLTVSWTGPNGYSSGPHDSDSHPILTGLSRGTYVGTVEDENGFTGTTSIIIQDKPRLSLSVSTSTNETSGEIVISSFKHNGLGLRYELIYLNTPETSQIHTGTQQHTFSNLTFGPYRLIATETQELQYNMGGGSSQVSSDSAYIYETFLTSTVGSVGSCESLSQFIGGDMFEAAGSTTQSFLEYYTGDNGSIDGLFDISNLIIKAPKVSPNDTTLPTDCSRASLKINIKKLDGVDGNTCDYVAFSLDNNGKILFTHSDGTKNYNITQECCSTLGYTPELNDYGVYNCRWKEVITDPCQSFILTTNSDNGYRIFVNGDTGQSTTVVPTAECCTKEGLVATQNAQGYSCADVVHEPTCEDYVFSGTFDNSTTPEERYAIFFHDGGTTNSVPTPECCTASGLESSNLNGNIRCYEAVPDCSGYVIKEIDADGYVVFQDSNGMLINEVWDSECCTDNGFDFTSVVSNPNLFKCTEKEAELDLPILEYVDVETISDECRLLKMRIIGIPNTWVKYRVTLLQAADHGYSNKLINSDTGETITPVIPAGGVGSYCEGSVFVGESGVTNLEMTTCARVPIRDFSQNCVRLKYTIFNYDNKTIKPQNNQENMACYSNL